MTHFALLLVLAAGNVFAADAAVDIDTAAKIYQEAAVREQVRASLVAMPKQIRDMFSRDESTRLTDEQLTAVDAAATHGFRIDVFEAPALSALAHDLDPASVAKIEAFLQSDLGRRLVTDDVIDRVERATRSTESTVDIFLGMGQAVAVGTAIGSGLDQKSVAERAQKSGEASRAGLEHDMREPMRRFLAYSYKDFSDSDLKHLLAFLESPAGSRYVIAYNAAMGAGYDAMGRRTGEQLGESLRELAQASLGPEARTPEALAAPESPPTDAPASPPVPAPPVPAPASPAVPEAPPR
jgi:hypothetical protein